MQDDELTELTVKMGSVLDRFQQRCHHFEGQQQALAHQLPAMLEQKLDDVLQALSGQAGAMLRDGLAAPTNHLQQRLRAAASEVEQATGTLKAAQRDMASQRKVMWWSLGAVLVLCVLSLAATYESLYGFYHSRYAQLRAQVTYLEAVNAADVVPCGDGKLCARVENNSPRYGDKKQYRVVAPRPR